MKLPYVFGRSTCGNKFIRLGDKEFFSAHSFVWESHTFSSLLSARIGSLKFSKQSFEFVTEQLPFDHIKFIS